MTNQHHDPTGAPSMGMAVDSKKSPPPNVAKFTSANLRPSNANEMAFYSLNFLDGAVLWLPACHVSVTGE